MYVKQRNKINYMKFKMAYSLLGFCKRNVSYHISTESSSMVDIQILTVGAASITLEGFVGNSSPPREIKHVHCTM